MCVGDGKVDVRLGEVWRVRIKCSESLCAIFVVWEGKKPMDPSSDEVAGC